MLEVFKNTRTAAVEQLLRLVEHDLRVSAAAAEIIGVAAEIAADVAVKLDLGVVFIADILDKRIGERAAEIVKLPLSFRATLSEAEPARDTVCEGNARDVRKVVKSGVPSSEPSCVLRRNFF